MSPYSNRFLEDPPFFREQPKYRGKIILGMTYFHCDQCGYMVPQSDIRGYERQWFLGLFHHVYRVCIQCLKQAGVDEKKIIVLDEHFEAWIEKADGTRIT